MTVSTFLIGVLVGGFLLLAGVLAGAFLAAGHTWKQEQVKKPPEGAGEIPTEEEARRSKAIDEGIQNLMTYSANGHDGFDRGGI